MIDCVIGAAIGYPRLAVRPFLRSLRLSGYDGRVVLFANKGGAEEAKDWDAEVLPCPKVNTLPHAERFYWIQEWLACNKPSGVFCSDVRDVFFQKNPSELPTNGIHAFEEDLSVTISTCPYNSDWVKIGYGDTVLKQIGFRPISCVGTLCGDHASMLQHLTLLVSELKRLQPKTSKPQDQSCHNYILTHGGVHVWPNEEGEVYTVGYIKPYGRVPIVNDYVVNSSGKVPTVIHQGDRHPNIVQLINERYS